MTNIVLAWFNFNNKIREWREKLNEAIKPRIDRLLKSVLPSVEESVSSMTRRIIKEKHKELDTEMLDIMRQDAVRHLRNEIALLVNSIAEEQLERIGNLCGIAIYTKNEPNTPGRQAGKAKARAVLAKVNVLREKIKERELEEFEHGE